MKKLILGALPLLLVLGACGSDVTDSQRTAMQKATTKADSAEFYEPKNDLERHNYNRRQEIADDPTTILWCTFFPFGETGPITFPAVGKMTSGNKRPYPTEKDCDNDSSALCHPELPGPDGMYGSSGEYRYGFGPDGVYHDVYGLDTYCTTQPMVYRRQSSGMNVAIVDPRLAKATAEARRALKAGQKGDTVSAAALAQANRILTEATTQSDR